MLTDAQRKEYVKKGYGNCPYCKSDQIEGGSLDFHGKQISQKVMCLDCEKYWHGIYTLTDVEEDE